MFERSPDIMAEQGADLCEYPKPDAEQMALMEAVEARITTEIDVRDVVERKHLALATHPSQIEESFWSRLPAEAFGQLFGEEFFIRAHDTTGAPTPETDLFSGLR